MPGVMISYQRRYFLIRRKHSWLCLQSLVTLVTRLMVHNSSFALLEGREWTLVTGQTRTASLNWNWWAPEHHFISGHWLGTLGLWWCQGNLPSLKWLFSKGCTEQIVNTIILLLNPSLDYGNWSLQGISELLNCRLLVFKLKLILGWTVSASNQLLDNSRFNI